MKIIILISFLLIISCKKSDNNPKSKPGYMPIISANTPASITQGQPIVSQVKFGFYERYADVTFLGFEIKENSDRVYDIRAKAFYTNIQYGISQPVVMISDTFLVILQNTTAGKYILRFYSSSQLVEADTVLVN